MNCKEQVVDGWTIRKCARAAVSDGYCKQHHPDAVKKRREESDRRYQKQLEESPYRLLAKANERIADLEAELADYKQRVATWNSGANSCTVYKLEEENKQLRAECGRISEDYIPDHDQDASLALSEMREAIAALATEV